jgi:trans-2,3-dihydro-3-hydroxyanthranilate isomerase
VRDAPDGAAVAGRCALPDPVGAWWVAMPLPYLLLEVADAATVAAAGPDFERLGEHFGTFLFARSAGEVRARFFAPAAAVPEDPATGSAAVALAALLRSRGEENGAVEISQGSEIGHPSRILLEWDGDRVSIGGTVVRDEVRFLEA